MRVYAETNFVLEVALEQEELSACKSLIEDAGSRRISLVVPAFSVFEPYYKIAGNGKRRRDLAQQVDTQAREFGRTRGFEQSSKQLRELIQVFAKSEDDEQQRFTAAITSVLEVGELIALTGEVVNRAVSEVLKRLDLQLPDAIVYASILQHIESSDRDDTCFVTKNSKDFADPDIEAELAAIRCKIRFGFQNCLDYVRK